jgi:hypothetical protein
LKVALSKILTHSKPLQTAAALSKARSLKSRRPPRRKPRRPSNDQSLRPQAPHRHHRPPIPVDGRGSPPGRTDQLPRAARALFYEKSIIMSLPLFDPGDRTGLFNYVWLIPGSGVMKRRLAVAPLRRNDSAWSAFAERN